MAIKYVNEVTFLFEIHFHIAQYMSRGVYSSRKSKLFPSAMRRLQNPSPTSKVTGFFNQGCRSVFDMGGGVILCCAQGGVWGGCAPLRSWKICIFETGIVQFDEYFWEQIYSRWWWVKNQFYRPDWPKFCILGVILVKIVSKNWNQQCFAQNLLIWAELFKDKSEYFHLDAQQWRMIAIPSHWSNILRVYPPSPWDLCLCS